MSKSKTVHVFTNSEIVKLLRDVAAALLIKDANRFRIIAYEKAADSVEHLTSELKDVWDEGKLEGVPGIGPTIAAHIDELFRNGNVKHFGKVFHGLSPALFPLLLVPGLGPKKAFRLTREFQLTNPKTVISDLQKLALRHKIAVLEGFGEKSEQLLLSGLESFSKGQIKENRMPLPYADRLAQEVIDYLQKHPAVVRVDVLGSLRRKVATIGDIDLAAMTENPLEVVKYFTKYHKLSKIIDQGEKGATILLTIGRQVDLRVQSKKSYGAMLQYFTGSKHHNIKLREFALKKGLSLSEHGIKAIKKLQNSNFKSQNYNKKLGLYEFESEKAFYGALGLPEIPPELREDAGEIEAAQQHKLPNLVTLKDIKGDFHVHSNYDLEPSHDLGANSLTDLLNQSAQLGYSYLGISDHNPSMKNHTEVQIVSLMKTRREKLERQFMAWKNREKKPIQPFYLLEVDILPSGLLALPNDAFKYIDAAIVSVHSSFTQGRSETTKRILTALAHPKAKILGHPTARLIGEREGIDADWNAIFTYCAANGRALEINSWPERLDLPDRLVREALSRKVKFIINTDAHHVDHLTNMKYGVDVARRGWVEAQDVLNTMGYNELSKWLKS
ncbi:TPA: hypothetical protein DIV55_00175 [Patescibacteria group bacterium]|uniref:PHP domain protein n=1 Tax=Candidatus Gottesmanbacteria bacterium GW2011_GWA1_43_11 TaxID=1618436 RepID=A0A0G1F9Z7_9BACT|nr:MAG: PHP domain protein [Candidatus Gottesmanbacteria bacterium GW2011_GWA1_43_11]HCS78142.1 hypothetical protein [Patescibacteria group bacterium]